MVVYAYHISDNLQLLLDLFFVYYVIIIILQDFLNTVFEKMHLLRISKNSLIRRILINKSYDREMKQIFFLKNFTKSYNRESLRRLYIVDDVGRYYDDAELVIILDRR